MGDRKGDSSDFYQVLGLKKECTEAELRIAYKKLALRWHPDRCSASGNSKFVEEAKMKFQAIQQAYSVLSDVNKRFLYDVGVYDSDDDENGMGNFLNEMAVMMSQHKPKENREESFEELKELFEKMFRSDIESFGLTSQTSSSSSFSFSSSSFASCDDSSNTSHKQRSSQMEKTRVEGGSSGFDAHLEGFCFGTGGAHGKLDEREGSRRVSSRKGRK